MLIDIAVNITDSQLAKNQEMLDQIIGRARESNVMPVFTGIDCETSRKCVELARRYRTVATVGIHPTSSQQCLDVSGIECLVKEDVVVAVGECGLDYDRLEFADVNSQKRIFRSQLDLNGECYFFHSRTCHRDFMEMICDYSLRGVVHSFTGTHEEAKELIRKGLYIGINGCSVKTEEGIEVLKELPIDSILVETDSPYCKIRNSYAGSKYVTSYFDGQKALKKRNEPCCVIQVAEVISKVKNMEYEVVADTLLNNTFSLYGDKVRYTAKLWQEV
ncbi:Mg-dependent DNase [Ordospora colligata]|uniref:Mg-dependent DNase n=1 Tax=Ordospora colligata OC4 TaxID=1354746 RepID=A0A0B2UMH4_9MICR|nr:Mg-dependent DNase [Ordospora colligata OC4]XP_014564207.1 Mg-dependent DNase [Ordospora colligata OC4]TBU16403.1 Mg-dependent DNase [Ordospora colligata]KHN70021.1 Mg-dependent DNase [Ordospora colligata OC4]KHN70165.1 Mg-dependent DNase [Ordospora colligata OC4]TBU16588.1 Mg-dependent DNase [Ordospora colligata]TBU19161.1 Mg-dependent DNase [Ordospora colligata]